MRGLIFLIVLLFSSNSYSSDEVWLHLGMLSKHLSSKDYNETHGLIGLEYNDWYVGYYDNSNYKDSYFVFKRYTVNRFDKYLPNRTGLKLNVGLISGYADVIDGVMPAIIPVLTFDYEPVSIDVNILGKIFSVEFKFKLR